MRNTNATGFWGSKEQRCSTFRSFWLHTVAHVQHLFARKDQSASGSKASAATAEQQQQ
jgi:hypothetical protein